jgi:hypothetical protein
MTRPDQNAPPPLDRLLGPAGAELTCGQCFDELDRYVELELAGAPADEQVAGMRAHFEGCPACDEDHDSLLAFVASEQDRTHPDRVTGALGPGPIRRAGRNHRGRA